MRRRTKFVLCFVSTFLIAAAISGVTTQARADEALFRNGDRISGRIIDISEGKMRIVTEYAGEIIAEFEEIVDIRTDSAGVFRMKNGDLITGTIRAISPERIFVESDTLGALELPLESFLGFTAMGIDVAESPEPDKPQDASQGEARVKEGVAPAGKTSSESSDTDTWSGSFALGVQLQRGNTDTADVHTEIKAKRVVPREELSLRFYLDYGETEGETDQNKAFGQAKLKVFQTDRRYLFGSTDMEYDEMKNLDLRAQVFGGLGYKFIDRERTKLVGEAGGGVTGEFFDDAGDEETLEASAFLNAEWTQHLFEGVIFQQTLTLFPSLGDFGDFRLRSETGLLSPLGNGWKLKLSLIDDYDSDPESEEAEKNDLRFISAVQYNF